MDEDGTALNQKGKHRSADKFCATAFVTDLMEEGERIPCDRTNKDFNNDGRLPSYYDAKKFQRGQQFFHKHIWAMFFAKIMGLMTILAVPDLSRILKFTGMSNTPYQAYKRYLATIFHMYMWYNHDFSPDSKLWKSIEMVKYRHNDASQRCRKVNKHFVSQKNMALTQFGFMGYIVWKTKLIGIYGAEEADLQDFIHVWRVIGYVLGIEERFNICRESVGETRDICQELALRVFKPKMTEKHPDFLKLSHSLLTGMWCMQPLLEYKAFIHVNVNVLASPKSRSTNNNNAIDFVDFDLNLFEKIYARMIIGFMSLFRFNAVRIFHQYVIYVSIWLMEHFPFLAYYSFGRMNSHVKVL